MTIEDSNWLDFPVPRSWCLLHRGADPIFIHALVQALEAKHQTVTISYPHLEQQPLVEFRAAVRAEIERGHEFFLILLNRNFDGLAFKQTLSLIQKEFYAVSFSTVRTDSCDVADLWLYADISNTDNLYEKVKIVVQAVVLTEADLEMARCK